MTPETRRGQPALTPPILFFLTAEPVGRNLTIFASEQAVANEMDVWRAREEPNETFDGRGRRLAFEFRNDTAHEFLGGLVKVGGEEYAVVSLAQGDEVASAPTLLTLLQTWLSNRTGSTYAGTSLTDLITRCIEAGAPVRG